MHGKSGASRRPAARATVADYQLCHPLTAAQAAIFHLEACRHGPSLTLVEDNRPGETKSSGMIRRLCCGNR